MAYRSWCTHLPKRLLILLCFISNLVAIYSQDKQKEPNWDNYAKKFSEYYSRGDIKSYANAFVLLLEHKEKAIQYDNCLEYTHSLRRLAILYETMNKNKHDLDTALVIIQEAENKARKCDLFDALVKCLVVKGVVYRKLEKYEASLNVLKDALQVASSHGSIDTELPIYPRIIFSYLAIDQIDSAIFYQNIAQKKLFSCKNNELVVIVESELIKAQIDIWWELKKYKPALEAALCMITHEEVKENFTEAAHYYRIAGVCYENLEDYKNALLMYHKKGDAEGSVSNREYLKKIKELEVQYSLKINELKIVEQESDIKIKRILLFFLAIVLLFMLIIGAIIVKNYLQEKRLNKDMTAKNKELKKEQEKNLLLFKELQHRVKNNLQVLTSLNRMEMRQLVNQDALNFAQNLQNRILTLGALYEDLFKQDNKNVNLRNYIEHIGNEIINSMGAKNIKVDNKLSNVNVQPNGAMYLGLIINELITNSVKHNLKSNHTLTIQFLFEQTESAATITYLDDGTTLAENILTKNTPKGFGINFIELLTSELDGEATWNFKNGCRVIFKFSNLAWFLADEYQK